MKRLRQVTHHTNSVLLFALLSFHLLFAQQGKSHVPGAPPIAADSTARSRALDSLLQIPTSGTLLTSRPIGFREYLATVAASNLDLAVQKYNVSIAQAQVTVANLYPDPSLSSGVSKDITNVPPEQRLG